MTRTLLFVATEDWFVRSHFLPMLSRARADGWSVIVAARVSEAAKNLADAGARVTPLQAARGAMGPAAIGRQVREMRAILTAEKPDLVHAIGLKPSVVVALAGAAAPQAGIAFAMTGLGFLGAARDAPARIARSAALHFIAHAARKRRAVILLENDADARRFVRRGVDASQLVVLPGAGIDAAHFMPLPEPPEPPLRVGIAARLVRSKGVDIAVAAVEALRRDSENIELLIAGAPDPENPASYAQSDLAAWRASPGVRCLGALADVRTLWADAHIALLPSRGGEGLPKSLLEAAACARPLITTNTPGCRDFVRDGEMGFVIPRDDARALADAIRRLLHDPPLRRRMAAAARARVEACHTERHVGEAVAHGWALACAQRG